MKMSIASALKEKNRLVQEIDRLWAAYPEVADDGFVKAFLAKE